MPAVSVLLLRVMAVFERYLTRRPPQNMPCRGVAVSPCARATCDACPCAERSRLEHVSVPPAGRAWFYLRYEGRQGGAGSLLSRTRGVHTRHLLSANPAYVGCYFRFNFSGSIEFVEWFQRSILQYKN